jgi:maltooligosyltrehalose trehalohydrolase
MTTSNRPLGANVESGGVRFGIWAPKAARIDVQVKGASGIEHHRLECDGDGVHTGFVAGLAAGARYRFRVDEGDAFPDMRSRFQPEGVHGASEVIDPSAYAWRDADWPGLTKDDLVVYELHVGTYTPEGSYAALERELPAIKRLGVTAIDLMPVADFPGERNWGYDGVAWFAPSRAYGRPDDLRRLIDAAHAVGLGVLLDVVYNHFGPDGNYARVYSDAYFTEKHATPWGDAINYFDGPGARFVRDFVIDNAIQWAREYHFDGFRLDATDTIFDESPIHILQKLQERVHAAVERPLLFIAEEARNSVTTIRPVPKGGFGIDAVWADDFHHAARVYLTGARENYYADYAGSMAELATAITEGFLYQGQPTSSGKPRGTKVTDEPASAFVFCLQNHDQIGNRPFGERLHHDIHPARYALATALLLFAPETPLLFMGQEFAASTPFLYFTDHNEELGKLVTEGRRAEFGGFRAFQDEAMRKLIPDPQAESTFLASKIDLTERGRNAGILELHRALLALRREDPVLANRDRALTRAVPAGAHAIAVHRWLGDEHRLLIANFGARTSLHADQLGLDERLSSATWTELLSTGEERFGGLGNQTTLNVNGSSLSFDVPARTAVIYATMLQP